MLKNCLLLLKHNVHFKYKGLLKKSNCVLDVLVLFTEASGRGVQNKSPEPGNKKATVLLEKEKLAISFGVSVQILFRRADIKNHLTPLSHMN